MAMPPLTSLARFAANQPITETNHPSNYKLVTKQFMKAGKLVTQKYWTIMLPGGASVGQFSTPAKAYAYAQKHPEDVNDPITDTQPGGMQPNSSGIGNSTTHPGTGGGGGGTGIPGLGVGGGSTSTSSGSSTSSGVSGSSTGGGATNTGGTDTSSGDGTTSTDTISSGQSGGGTSNQPGTGVSTNTGLGAGDIPLSNDTALDPRTLASSKMNELFKSIMDQVGNDANTTQFNNSANRLRERLDSAGAGNAQTITNRNLSRGFGNSGLQDQAIERNNLNTQGQYAQGLSSLSDAFEKNRLTGLGIAKDAAQGAANNSNFIDKTLYDFLNSVNLQNTQRLIAGSGNKTSQTIAGMNNLSAQQIAQLEAQIQAWIASLRAGTGQ